MAGYGSAAPLGSLSTGVRCTSISIDTLAVSCSIEPMGGLSLLAASIVLALLGFGWVNAIKEGVFDVWAFITGDKTEEVMEDKTEDLLEDDAERGDTLEQVDDSNVEGNIQVDPEFDGELNFLESELDDLLQESESELNALEGEL